MLDVELIRRRPMEGNNAAGSAKNGARNYGGGVVHKKSMIAVVMLLVIAIVVMLLAIANRGTAVQSGEWEVTGVGESLDGIFDSPARISYGFHVSDGGKLLSLNEQFVVIDACCEPFGYFIENDSRTIQISEGGFSFADDYFLFEGAFDSNSTAHGTWRVERSVVPEEGLLIYLSQGTWIASHIGTSTMVSATGRLATTWGRIKSTRN